MPPSRTGWPEPAVPRTAGPVLRGHAPEPLPGAIQGRAGRARQPPRGHQQDRRFGARRPARRRHRGRGHWPREDPVRHLPQDGRPEKSFSDVLDIYGFRVIVHTLPECYLALGTLHQLYRPVPGKFKDYIAFPKVNGYQSLHTTLVGPYGTPVEFQFRTRDMHHVAEEGVASHWLYKGADLTPQRPAEAHSPVAAIAAGHPKPDRRFRRVPGARQGRPVPRRCLCSPRAARSSRCRAAPRRWTSPTRFTPTSATRPWPPRSTASSCRCAPK